MADINQLVELKSQLKDLKSKLDSIGKMSLFMIKRCEVDRIRNDEFRDLAIKINYFAHEVHEVLDKFERK